MRKPRESKPTVTFIVVGKRSVFKSLLVSRLNARFLDITFGSSRKTSKFPTSFALH